MKKIAQASKSWIIDHPRILSALANVAYRQFRIKCVDQQIQVRRGNKEIRINVKHAPYLRDVLREFDYYFDTVVADELPNGAKVADFSSAREQNVRGIDIPFVFPGLPEGGDTNNSYLEFMRLDEGETVVDLGAYAGLTAYLFARAVGQRGRVIAVEADPQTYGILQQNVARARQHSIASIETLNAAIWNQIGTIDFLSEGNMGATVAAHSQRNGKTVSVPTTTLDQLVERFGLTRLDAIKMDVEGAEYEVLPAAIAVLQRFHPRIVIEVHLDDTGRINTQHLRQMLEAIGYETLELQQSTEQRFPLIGARPRA